MNNFIPYDDRIVVEPIKRESMLVSDEKIESGKVISVGKKVKFVKKGDTLFFTAWAWNETPEVDGVRYYVVQESDGLILGKINGQTKSMQKQLSS